MCRSYARANRTLATIRSSTARASIVSRISALVEVHLVRQVPQQAADLGLLVVLERDDAVVQLDGLGRLDEQGRPGVAAAVDDARDPPAVLGRQRQHQPVLVEGRLRIAEPAGQVAVAEEAVEHVPDVDPGLADLGADRPQLGAGVVADLAAAVDHLVDGVGQGLEVADPLAEPAAARRRSGSAWPPSGRSAGWRRGSRQPVANSSGSGRWGGTAERTISRTSWTPPNGGRPMVALASIISSTCLSHWWTRSSRGDRLDLDDHPPPERATGVLRQDLANAVELDLVQRMRVHSRILRNRTAVTKPRGAAGAGSHGPEIAVLATRFWLSSRCSGHLECPGR